MPDAARHDLLLIRHAPALTGGCMAGRRDVPADLGDRAALPAVRRMIGPVGRIIASPARRCIETAQALFDLAEVEADPRLWEQDFGAWEGLPYADLPDLGPLSGAQLAVHRPPDGESFADLCARTLPALEALIEPCGPVAIVAHAGTVRAGLAMALGDVAAALRFSVEPLSLTRLCRAGEGWAVLGVNQTAQAGVA
ncbi:MAG: histidine phosphatase family protein [Sphingomonadales bacterium]|nr:histidine phosphatase family protein [Sphingomonadales bacterium]MDE2167939.1 histidine phosphatase family protein [Sphingomonadales bacterium]